MQHARYEVKGLPDTCTIRTRYSMTHCSTYSSARAPLRESKTDEHSGEWGKGGQVRARTGQSVKHGREEQESGRGRTT